MAVVVVLVRAEHRDGMPLIDDQGAVEEFAADAADENVRRSRWPAAPELVF